MRLLSRASDRDLLIAWLLEQWNDVQKRKMVIDGADLFDESYYLNANSDVAIANMNGLEHFIGGGELEGRSPSSYFDTRAYLRARTKGVNVPALRNMLQELVIRAPWNNAMPLHYSLTPNEEISMQLNKSRLQELTRRRERRIAVVAHLYYRDIVKQVLQYISNIDEEFDLIVTLPTWGADEIESIVLKQYPDAVLCRMPNRGRDIGPFLEVLPFLMERNYTALLKLQTKKGYYLGGRAKPDWGTAWRYLAYESLLGNAGRIQQIMDAFHAEPRLSMVGTQQFLVSVADYPSVDAATGHWTASQMSGPHKCDVFFAGTMFWVRPQCLSPLATENFKLTAFQPETGANDEP